MSPQRFAKRLRTLRLRQGLTQAALATKAGVSRAYLARLEMGRHDPPLSRVVKIAKGLRVSVAELIGMRPGGARGQPVSFDTYLAAQQRNIEQLQRMPQFRELVLPMHDLYELAVALVPPTTAPYFGRLLLLSHSNFLSAATLALRALPDDA